MNGNSGNSIIGMTGDSGKPFFGMTRYCGNLITGMPGNSPLDCVEFSYRNDWMFLKFSY
jgi:hypothetical protein